MNKIIGVGMVVLLTIFSVIGYYFIPGIRVTSNVAATTVPAATNYPFYVESVQFTPVLLLFIPLGVLVVGLVAVLLRRRGSQG